MLPHAKWSAELFKPILLGLYLHLTQLPSQKNTTDTQSQTSRHTGKEASGCDDVGQKTPSPPPRTAKSPVARSNQPESRNKSGENTQKRKAPKLNRPPRYTENPVTMYNKYGALDTEEGMESEIETGIG